MSAEYLLGILVLAILVTNALETISQQKFGTEIRHSLTYIHKATQLIIHIGLQRHAECLLAVQ